MEIKTDLVLSSINDTVFALLNNVSFVSAASITDSSVAVQQHTVMIPDDIVAHVIINTDTCLLSISGTWSKSTAHSNHVLIQPDNWLSEVLPENQYGNEVFCFPTSVANVSFRLINEDLHQASGCN